MRFGQKVVFRGARVWLHDLNGKPAFGILRGEISSIENVVGKPMETLELSGYVPNTGHSRIRFEGEDLRVLVELLPLLHLALEQPSPNE